MNIDVEARLRAALEEAITLPLGGGFQMKQGEWRKIATEYDARLVPAEDEGRLREALAAVELYPTQWQEGLPVDIDTYRRGILAILRAALAATPEPRP